MRDLAIAICALSLGVDVLRHRQVLRPASPIRDDIGIAAQPFACLPVARAAKLLA
ncbi:MAG TPA: hypothetical protein VGK72_11595 [Chthoniobacterales bacterium]